MLISINSVFAWRVHDKALSIGNLILQGYEVVQVNSHGDGRYTYHLVNYKAEYYSNNIIYVCEIDLKATTTSPMRTICYME